jgi:pyruvate/2-oxoacid:ferredoxin oxidoreductase beta subunit/NAD-dependent dihydropyrimidine dehydrogenase PreA subunit
MSDTPSTAGVATDGATETAPSRPVTAEVVDPQDFFDRVVAAYEHGTAEQSLPADLGTARSFIPAGTAAARDFSYIAPDIPEFIPGNCTACMECVTECPDTAILGKVIEVDRWQATRDAIADPAERDFVASQWAKTGKFHDFYAKKKEPPGMFGIVIDPTKCKGCAECVTVCGSRNALKMIRKDERNMPLYRKGFDVYRKLGDTPKRYIQERLLSDMMLAGRTLLYVGGAGSCMGCGEATALRMMLAATAFVHGPENIGLVASTGCNTVYTSTYPYNPYLVPWTNSLFENSATVAMGVRLRWDQMGWQKKRLWCIGGDGAFLDIGFQSLSRMLASGADIKVLVLDTQVYSNTGGQASTSSYLGQNTSFSLHGKEVKGKTERRKELAPIAMMHADVFVAQTTCAHWNHFYRSIVAANEFPGPAIVLCYTTCQPEHGVADHLAGQQARLAVDSRAFPLAIYDPRKGSKIRERLDLKGNPAHDKDWYVNPKTGEQVDFITFARSEGRFAKHFDAEGKPNDVLKAAMEDRLANWRLLQELAGIRV